MPMSLCCRLNAIPPKVRIVLGTLAVVLGIPVFILPVPLGLAMIAAGIALMTSATPSLQSRLKVVRQRFPRLYEAITPLTERCRRCPAPRASNDHEKGA
jgi:hypothetical protein